MNGKAKERIFVFVEDNHQATNQMKKSNADNNVVKIKYKDIYQSESCQRTGQCSNDDRVYRIPEQSLLLLL